MTAKCKDGEHEYGKDAKGFTLLTCVKCDELTTAKEAYWVGVKEGKEEGRRLALKEPLEELDRLLSGFQYFTKEDKKKLNLWINNRRNQQRTG